MKTSTLPRFKRFYRISGLPTVSYDVLRMMFAESREKISPSTIDGFWRGYPVRIYYADEERVSFSIYNPEKKKWSPLSIPAEEFYPDFTPFKWSMYIEQLSPEAREKLRELAHTVYRYYRSRAWRRKKMRGG